MTRMIKLPIYSPQTAAQLYVEARAGSLLPISVADAVRALRTLLIESEMTDEELGALVAQAAFDLGLSVTFDGNSQQDFPTFELPGQRRNSA